MFVSDRIVFLELHKTGCTHIRHLLKELVGGELVGKHNKVDPRLFAKDRLFLGSVRDPWDWYVSLWAYGCDHKGSIFASVVKGGIKLKGLGWRSSPLSALRELLGSRPRSNAEKWQRTYQDVNDAAAFRDWLHMMHDREFWSDFGEGYGQSRISNIAGLFTYRYINLFCRGEELLDPDATMTFDQLVEREKSGCFINHFIRNENLETDLFAALERSGVEVAPEKKSEILSRSRTNTSSRKHGPDYYYDADSENVVAARERLITGKFGYVPPSLRP